MNTGYILLGLAGLFIVGIIGVVVALAVVLRQNSKRRALASRGVLERALDPKNFYITKPKRPGVDMRAWMLSAPSLAAVVGLFCFSVLAYSFTEISTWTDSFRHTMVIIGAFTLAAGSEIGTYAAVKEIFRRSRGGRLSKTDIGALFISGLATAAALFLSIAALMGARGGWPDWVVQYGPIGVIICTALDAYAGMMESGLYESTFDDRYEEWQEKYHRWCEGVSAQLGYSERNAPATQEVELATQKVESATQGVEPAMSPVRQVINMVLDAPELVDRERVWLLDEVGILSKQRRIAEELGVNPSTVSRAMSRKPSQLGPALAEFVERMRRVLQEDPCTESSSSPE